MAPEKKFRIRVAATLLLALYSAVHSQDLLKWKPPMIQESDYEEIWGSNPFNRKTTAKPTSAGPSFADDWVLAGISVIGDKRRVLLVNRKTREYETITNRSPGAETGFALLKINTDPDRSKVSAELEKDGVKATVRFDSKMVPKGTSNRNTARTEEQKDQPKGGKGKPAPPGQSESKPPVRPRGGSRLKVPGDIGMQKSEGDPEPR